MRDAENRARWRQPHFDLAVTESRDPARVPFKVNREMSVVATETLEGSAMRLALEAPPLCRLGRVRLAALDCFSAGRLMFVTMKPTRG